MKKSMTPFMLLVLLLVAVGGYYGYTYLKQRPPNILINAFTKTDPPPPLPPGDIAPLSTPEGFTATIFSREVPNARVMIRDPKGTMLVSQTKDGKVVALPDLDADGRADRTISVLEGLDLPPGLAFVCPSGGAQSASQDGCKLYIAETGAVRSYEYDADTFTATSSELITTLPTGGGHFTRTLLLHPDGRRLLVSVGSSCNVCTEDDARRASVLAINLETKEVMTYATGLRNTVFMAVVPATGQVWGTDNGRDMLGDNVPPDEVNRIEEVKDYGWPLCYGNSVHDTDFDNSATDPCSDKVPPHIPLQAHSAALGLAFIPEEGWPEAMRNDLLIAYHGSWNRSTPTGYKVVRFDLDSRRNPGGGPIDFLTGFLEPGAPTDDAIGRPVDVLIEPNAVYISDDRAGAVYRITPTLPAQ